MDRLLHTTCHPCGCFQCLSACLHFVSHAGEGVDSRGRGVTLSALRPHGARLMMEPSEQLWEGGWERGGCQE